VLVPRIIASVLQGILKSWYSELFGRAIATPVSLSDIPRTTRMLAGIAHMASNAWVDRNSGKTGSVTGNRCPYEQGCGNTQPSTFSWRRPPAAARMRLCNVAFARYGQAFIL
jgi:hypothetical protein